MTATVTIRAKVAEVGARRGKHTVLLEVEQGEAARLAHAGLLYQHVDVTLSESDDAPKRKRSAGGVR